MDSENDDETASSDCSCPPLTSSSQCDDETASPDSSRPPLMEDYQYEMYIFNLMGDYQYETYIFKLMMLDRQLIRETFDSWATFKAIDDSA